jgi:hypothetical protein
MDIRVERMRMPSKECNLNWVQNELERSYKFR